MRRVDMAAILVLGAGVTGSSAGWAADATAGRALAETWCAACHSTDPAADSASDAAPSFAGMAKGGLSAGELRARIAAPHPPMPQIDPSEAQLDDLVAYIGSLSDS